MNSQSYLNNGTHGDWIYENQIHAKILSEINYGQVRNNYLKIESISPDFSLSSADSDKSIMSNDLLSDGPIAVSFHSNRSSMHEVIQLNKVLNTAGIKHIALVADEQMSSGTRLHNFVYADKQFDIFHQFGLMTSDPKDLETLSLNAIYLIDKDRSIKYSKLFIADEPINFLSIINTYTAMMHNNKEK